MILKNTNVLSSAVVLDRDCPESSAMEGIPASGYWPIPGQYDGIFLFIKPVRM